MLRNGTRLFPKLGHFLRKKFISDARVQTPLVSCRHFHQRRNDPFAQMENFMKDMERRFWGEVNQNFPWFSFPRIGGSPSSAVETASKYSQGIFGPSNLSTSSKFKLAFNFPQAKPEDIKVSLKDRLLTVEAKVEETSENSKVQQTLDFKYTLPESVDVESLESVLTHDGMLTIEAPKTPDEAPRTINIKRE